MIHTMHADFRVLAVGCALALLVLGDARTSRAASPSAKSLTVAVVSPQCVFGNVETNLNHFTDLIEEASANGLCF